MEELTKNFTENEKRNLTNTKLHCFPEAEFAAEVNYLLIFIAVLNIFLSITALLGNTLILSALRKETSLQPASKILYRNLTITDLCVGVVVQPLGAAYSLSEVNGKWIICYYTGLTAFYFRCYTVLSIFDNSDCNKRGQTSRFVVGVQI